MLRASEQLVPIFKMLKCVCFCTEHLYFYIFIVTVMKHLICVPLTFTGKHLVFLSKGVDPIGTNSLYILKTKQKITVHSHICNIPSHGRSLLQVHFKLNSHSNPSVTQQISPIQRHCQASIVNRKDWHNLISISKDLPNRWPWIIFKAWLKLVRWKCLTQELPLCVLMATRYML